MNPLSQGTLSLRPYSTALPSTNIGARPLYGQNSGLGQLLSSAKNNISNYLTQKNTPATPPQPTQSVLSSPGVKAVSPTLQLKTPSNSLTASQTDTSKPVTPSVQPQYAAPQQATIQSNTTQNNAGLTPPVVNPNAGFQQNVQGPPGTPSANTSPSNIFSLLMNTATGNQGLGQSASDISQKYAKEIQDIETQGANAQAGQLSTGLSPVARGNAALIAQNTAAQKQAAVDAGNFALQGNAQQLSAQQQQQSGLSSLAGLTPDALRYGGFGQNNLSPNSLLPSLAQQVQQGLIDPSTATTIANSIYGGSGAAMLNQALQGGGYNYIQGQANANAQSSNLQQTQQQGQQTNQSVSYANNVLDQLLQAYNGLGGLQKTGVPLVNQAAGAASSELGIGAGATQAFNSTYGEAITAITQALASSGSVNPSLAGNIAQSILPQNPSPDQITAAKNSLQQLLGLRQSTYTSPPNAVQYGGSQTTNGQSSSNPPGWF